MEAKHLIDFLALLTLGLTFWAAQDAYKSQVGLLTKLAIVISMAFTSILAWVYVYATIGLDLANWIGE